MTKYIALLRGINVGGKNKLPMKALTTTLTEAGYSDVKTYIQSGNVVFHHNGEDTRSLATDIASLIHNEHGFEPAVLVLTVTAFENAMKANPFRDAEEEPATLHLSFLDHRPVAPDLDKLNSLKAATERFELQDQVFYLHAPDGIGRSKLAAQVEKALGVPATARNWRSVQKILEMARA